MFEDALGTVEQIGLKTARLRSLSGEQVVLSNAEILRSRIRNYKRMQERRVVFRIGVTYQTSHDLLRRLPEVLRSAVESQQVNLEIHRRLTELGVAFAYPTQTLHLVSAASGV